LWCGWNLRVKVDIFFTLELMRTKAILIVDTTNTAPSQIKVWRGSDGELQTSYECDIGNDRKGDAANPSIACVVFCRLIVNGLWVESMIVGLHCICPTSINWEEDYSDFTLDKAREVGEGNILPFYEHAHNGRTMETWREHSGIIRAMAVVPKQVSA